MNDKKRGGGLRGVCGVGCSPFALLFYIITLFAVPSFSHAAIMCLDTLALAKLDAKVINQEIPQGWHVRFLDHTFGDPMPQMEYLAKQGKIGGFGAKLRNTVCVRNRNCASNEPRWDDMAGIERDARKWGDFAKKYANLECIIDPWLEHDVKDARKVQQAVDAVKRGAPHCKVAMSTFTGVWVPGVIKEKHGNQARQEIVSNDGESLFDSDSPKYRTQGSFMVCGWIPRFNLRVTGEKVFTTPLKRNHQPSVTDYRQVVRLLQPQTATPKNRPAICKSARTLKDAELWKTNAEDYGNGDARQNKPLLISKIRTQTLDLIAPDGRKVGCAKYYGPYQSGYHRHYVGSCSGDSGVSLMDKAKSEWLYISDRGACIRVNAIRRKGYFR